MRSKCVDKILNQYIISNFIRNIDRRPWRCVSGREQCRRNTCNHSTITVSAWFATNIMAPIARSDGSSMKRWMFVIFESSEHRLSVRCILKCQPRLIFIGTYTKCSLWKCDAGLWRRATICPRRRIRNAHLLEYGRHVGWSCGGVCYHASEKHNSDQERRRAHVFLFQWSWKARLKCEWKVIQKDKINQAGFSFWIFREWHPIIFLLVPVCV